MVLFLQITGFPLFSQINNSVELKADTNQLKLGQQTVLEVSVICSKDRKPVLPDWKIVLKDKLDIISASNADTLSITYTQLKIRQELIVGKYNEDTTIVDSVLVPLVKNRDTVFAYSNKLTIYPVLEKVDLNNDIRDIKGPEEIPYSWREMLPYIISFVALVIAGLLTWLIITIIRKIRKRKTKVTAPEPPKVIIPADIIALEKLNQLRTSEAWFTTDSKEYLTSLTDILREYIYNRWNFDARESTSEEILSAEFIQLVDDDHLQKLKDILSTADLVKFAKASTGTDENKHMLEKGILFVETTKEITPPAPNV